MEKVRSLPASPKEWISFVLSKDAPGWVQFGKYGACGAMSVVVFYACFFLFEWLVPGFAAETLDPSLRNRNLTIMLACAFVPSNVFAYISNRILVFTPGKHSPWKEFALFTLISGLSFAGGEVGKQWIVSIGQNNLVASFAFIISSALVNFVARKFLVFER